MGIGGGGRVGGVVLKNFPGFLPSIKEIKKGIPAESPVKVAYDIFGFVQYTYTVSGRRY